MHVSLPTNVQYQIDNLDDNFNDEWDCINERRKINQLENYLTKKDEGAPEPMKTTTPVKAQTEETSNDVQKLQKKKNALRKELNKKGILKESGNNAYDHYSYFSEAQYKKLATELFSCYLLEHKFDVLDVEDIVGTNGQPNGRRVKILFELYDVETGYCEKTTVYGEGIDKGDKALYKAFTGALKSYLANTFLIATGNEPENDGADTLSGDKLKSAVLQYMKGKGEVTSEQEKNLKKLSLKEIHLLAEKIIKRGEKKNA